MEKEKEVLLICSIKAARFVCHGRREKISDIASSLLMVCIDYMVNVNSNRELSGQDNKCGSLTLPGPTSTQQTGCDSSTLPPRQFICLWVKRRAGSIQEHFPYSLQACGQQREEVAKVGVEIEVCAAVRITMTAVRGRAVENEQLTKAITAETDATTRIHPESSVVGSTVRSMYVATPNP